MLNRVTQAARRPARGERGAALVEFALVAVALFTIVFSLIEGGLMIRARNAIDNAAADAARRGGVASNNPSADWFILDQLRTRGAISAATINYVVIYRATDGNSEPTIDCQAGTSVPGECNVYDRAEMDTDITQFGCVSPALDQNWCPTDRSTDPSAFEYIGVWVDANHTGFTGFLDNIDIIGNSVAPIEAGGI